MNSAWLEDYIALRETGSFTAAAKRRNSSQPAFSRRIQMLEDWLGVTLVDRSTRPPSFTHLANGNDTEIRSLLNHVLDLRNRLKGEQARNGRLRLAVQHTLTLSTLPAVLSRMNAETLNYTISLHSGDRPECINMLLQGDAELLLCYETEQYPANIPDSVASSYLLQHDAMVLVGKPFANGQTFGEDQYLPLLTYQTTKFLGRILWDQMMPRLASNYKIETVCISDYTSSIKELCLIGLGVAWLPQSLVKSQLECGDLVLFQDHSMRIELSASLFIKNLNTSSEQRKMWRSVLNAAFPDSDVSY